ncbi:putative RNA polymerase-associated transcription-specificity factor RAP94 [Linepithema humile entomopoxvirus 1]|uniref:putative RNA polymerase-associated transcription-specificity factor RAP94 n=1 Tax=Linepithema humile entomopoxvirus 1 TaxID=2259792 RepID=UPI000DF0C258|nr:putative RNA polymerase-associated transcription-specificity factor RAP94 [Linepithema humile entomopoxvirus 1]AXA52586.1 putative RNA polymerase-associated transcription-specificity factor RAP94 [Linepithema humile entomopoxvirus 1]
MENNIGGLIASIEEYMKTTLEDDKHNFDDFISKNRGIFSINFSEDFFVNEEDVRFLYSLVSKNINRELIIDYFNNSRIKVEKEILSSTDESNYVDFSELNFFNLILKYGRIIVKPKKMVFLWNIEREKDIELSKLFKSDDPFVIKYVSYSEINRLFNKNKEYFINTNTLVNFGNLSRIVGTSLSSKFLKLNYIVPFDKELKFNIFIYDNISFSNFTIIIDNVEFEYKEINIETIINDFIHILVRKLKTDENLISYYRLFLINIRLSYYLLYILVH